MKNKINQLAALFFIYLMFISPFSLAVDEFPSDQSSPQDQEVQYENAFNNDPTPENFNNLPNPTAADLAKVPNPTLENFNHLPPQQQGIYLGDLKNYQQEFAEQYYADPANWGANGQADTVFFKQPTGLHDFLQKGTAEKNAAQQYFINTFSAPYKFDQIADDFSFDQEKGMLKNGLTNLVLAEFKDDQSITGITSTAGGFEISRKIEEKEQKVSVAGAEAKTVSYDREKGSFTFQLPTGQQRFEIPADAQVTFTFDAGKVTVDGPASGLVNTKGDYAQFINHDGKLIISYNGDLDAENAEVITSRLFLDGRYSKKETKIQAWDVGLGGKQTVVVDKNACPEAGACIGVSTQGQWDARYLADKDKSKASILKINLDQVSSASSFYLDPSKPQPTEENKAEQLREQARQLRKPAQPPLQGNNAEVWINKDTDSKAITVTSKGAVAVSLYDARGNSAKPLQDTFSYRGLNGLSELDAQFSARTQTNVRGQAEFKNDQFKEGISTNQDGAVIKVTHDNFRPDQADVLRAECFDCHAGEAMVIQKSIHIAQETGIQGVFTGANRGSVRLTVDVDEKGKIKFEPSRQDLGFLSKQILQDGQEVSIGNNLLVSVPCGELECNFKLSRDPSTAELGAAYEFVDPKNPEAAVKKIEYPLTIGKALGNEAVLVSEQNAAEVNRLAGLIEEGKFNELSTLSFEKDDPGYAALKKKFLLESGLNLDAISDQKYARELQTIIETTQKAKESYKKYGIELDAFGNFKTREDAEKYQQIVNKGLGADVDELTRAKWDLSRMRVKEVEGLLAACQGTSYCSVSEKDLKAAKEEENKILKTRTANYNRWKALVVKAEIDKLKREADERAKREDKGIDATDKKELEDTKRRIDSGEKRKVGLSHTLGVQKGRVNGYRSEIRAKLEKEWLGGGGGGAVFKAIDWERYEADPGYVISLINKHAPRDFFDNKLDSEIYQLREDFRFDAQATTETERKVEQLNTNLKAFESQNQALIEKYRLEGKDDVAAEIALSAGKYQEVNTILSGPNLATQEGIKEVVRLGKDKDGNVVVLETIDVSVLAGQSVISDKVSQDIAGRAVRQQRDETLDQVALLYNYGYGNEAGAMLQGIEADNPELAQKLKGIEEVPEALLDPELVKLKKARLARTDYANRVLEQREKDLEKAAHQARLKTEAEDLGAGKEISRAWKGLNFDLTSTAGALGTVTGAGRLAEASFGFLTDSSEKAAADALGITKVRDDLDQQAFEEQERQIQQLHSLRGKLRDYEKKGLSASQAFADARAGIVRGADGSVLSSSDQLQISVGDEPAVVLLEFDLSRSIFSEGDKKLMQTMNVLDRSAFIDQRQQEYAAERRELEFSVIARDAETVQRFNRGKLAGEAAAKYQEAVAACPDCAGAKNVQLQLDTLKQNVLGDIIGVYTGETIGKSIAGGLERTGVTYTRETEETFRDMAIASFDALAVFDVAEVVVGAPLVAFDLLQKISKVRKAVDAAGTAVDAYRFASKGSREIFAAAKAAERAADTVEAAAEARKAVEAAKAALDAEIKAGQQASKYQKIKRAVNTPLGKFDRDVAKARNLEIDTIAAQTQNLNQAQRELTAARASGDTLAEGQSLVTISDAQQAITQSANNIDELNALLRVSNLAGPNRGVVRKGWDATFGTVFGAGPGEEVLTAENDFRKAADNFADASGKARLVGDTPEAVLSRARLDAAKESLEVAAEKLDDAYLDRKVERSKNAIRERLQQAQVSGSGDEVYDAVGADGVWKIDDLASNPAVRLEPEGTGLKFEVPEEAPAQLRIEVEEGNQLLLRMDTSDARAEAELEDQLFEVLADSEYAAANDVKARRLEAVGEVTPESLVSDAVDSCSLAAAAIYGLAACRTVAETPSAKLEEAPEIKLPPRVPGQDDWNDIVDVLDTRQGVRLEESALETLVKKEELFVGRGGEGVVLEIPEAARVNLPGVDKPAIIKVRNTDPGLEGIVNSFPEQSDYLNRLAERDAAPRVYQAEETYYIAEKLEGKSLEETILDRLSLDARAEYETYSSRYRTSKNPAELKEAQRVLRRARNEGELDDVQNAVEELIEVLKSENIEIADFHWNNVIVITTPEGKLQAKLIDAGFAVPGDPATIDEVYNNKLGDIMAGEGFEINGREIWQIKNERTGIGVSDQVDACVIAGGAIYGAACRVPEVAIPEAPVSGARAVTPAVTLDAAPEGYYNDVEELLRDPATEGLPVHGANPAFDDQLINAHGSHAQYIQSYERTTQENPVLQYLHQQFAATGTPEPRLTNPGLSTSSASKSGVVGFYENGGMFYRQFKNDDEVFVHAKEFFGYTGNNLEEAKQLIAQKQIKTLAGHETYHHAFQTHLPPAQKEVWSNFVRRDPNFQNAAQGLRELGFSEDHIVEELFTYRMDGHAFGKPELTEFAFTPSNDELKLLKEMGVLPPGYKRPTKATHLGEGVYELEGKRYFRGADGNWKQERKLWFNKEVDDNEIIQELFIEELNAFPEKEIIGVPDQLPEDLGIELPACSIGGALAGGAACIPSTSPAYQAAVADEVSVIKRGYTQQRVDVESIKRNHPTVEVKTADAAFTGKIGEGSVGVVFEGNLPGVGEDLAFKTAKTKAGEIPLRGNVRDNVDGLFTEFENAREVCQFFSCPEYYGIYEVDGIPYLVSQKVEGKPLFELTTDEMFQYDIEAKLNKFNTEVQNAVEAGWITGDQQALVLTEPQLIRGVQHEAGDIVVIDVADWRFEPEGVSTTVEGCVIAGGAIYGAACRVPEIPEAPTPTISGVGEVPKTETHFPERAPAAEQNLGKFKEGPEGFVSNYIAAQRAYDSLENGEVLRITRTKEGVEQVGLVTIEGNKKYLTTVDISSGATTKTELIPTISSMTTLDQTAIEKLVVEDFVGAVSIKRTGAKVDPGKVKDNLLDVVGRGETVPLGSTFAARKEDNAFTLGGKEYLYSTDEGWTTKGLLGFGKKQVINPQDLAHLEAARLNVPLTEFGAPRQRFYFSEYVAPEWYTGAINVLEAYRHDGGILVRSEANFYIIDEAGDIYSVRGKFVGGATGSVPEGVDKDLIIGALNTNPQLKERFLNDVSKLSPKVIDDVSKGKLYLHEIANDKKVTILAAGPDFDDIGVNVHGSHQGFVDSYNALSGLGPEVQGIETNPILKELHQRFKKRGVEPLRLTHNQVSVRQSSVLGAYEEIGDDIGGIRYQIFTDEKSVLDQAKAAHKYKGTDVEEAKRLLAQEQLKLLAGHETTHHAFATLLDQTQRDAWVNYVRTTNDPGMRKAWDYLKSTPNYGHLDDGRLADEMLAFRYDYHIYGDATSNFKFSPSPQELQMLESIGLPTPRTVAVETKTGVFSLADQEYDYDAVKQIWTTRGTGVGPLRFGKNQVTDPEIIARLDNTRLNIPIEEVPVSIEIDPIAAE
ncbi:MAG: hypothetical protein Q7S55_02690 [Nanoarchaeota archaeon]|nr:hypothetical protein [Nanoarchaeota archaeon]